MATVDLHVARRRARWAIASRIDARMLLGVVLVVASLAGGLVFWSAVRETVGVVVAARDINVGQVLQASDLSLARVRLDEGLSTLAIPEAELISLFGRTAGTTVHSGEMLVWPDMAQGPLIGSAEVAITVPVKAESVFAGIRPGDRVAVLATRAKGKPESSTATVVESALVYDLTREARGVALGSAREREEERRGITDLTLVVARSDAERVAHAMVNWDLTIVLLSPVEAPTDREAR